MSSKISQDIILNALKTVTVDGSTIDLVASGHVSGVVIKDGNVGFSLEIDPEDAEAIQPLRIAAEQAVMAIPGVLNATAMLTAHKKAPATPESAKTESTGTESMGRVLHQPAKYVIAVASGKGGVGKSTTAINLAVAIKEMGLKVGVLDADIYGPSLPRLTGITQKPQAENNKLIPLEAFGMKLMSIGFLMEETAPTIWRGPMVMSALEQMLKDVAWGDLDVMVIDMPPGTGDAQLTLSQRVKLAGAVIVSTPQDLALIDARKGLNMFLKVGVAVLGIVENMSHFICPSCGEQSPIFGHGGAAEEAERLGIPLLGQVPLEMDIRATSDAGTPITASQPDSPHAEIYKNMAKKIIDRLPETERTAPAITIK
jgi:ATP-binding protein involved in chromosome partitioning